jgi:myo-inositol-1(or 4)-monophosphatase
MSPTAKRNKVPAVNLESTLIQVARIIRNIGDRIARVSNHKKLITYKGAVDLVTQFDRQSQDWIVKQLINKFPDYGILSEENLRRNSDSRIKWIIDPLDGTTNFAHDLPIWSISIALEIENQIVLGAVYDPTRRELFTALTGRGAFLNRRRIRVSRARKLGQSLLVTGFPYDVWRSRRNNIGHFRNFCHRAQAVRRLGSAALDLCYTACGRFDGYWELKLSPWDQAAGTLIVKEAGGLVTDFHGRRFSVYGDEVLATNGLIHRPMIRVLLEK